MKLFLVVDFQKTLVDALPKDAASDLDKRIAERVLSCRYNGTDVAFTLGSGDVVFGNTASRKLMCDMVFEKNSLPSLDLADYLRQKEYSQVEICGLMSFGAVIANAVMVRSALPGTEIIINESLISADDKKLHREALDIMRAMGFTVIHS